MTRTIFLATAIAVAIGGSALAVPNSYDGFSGYAAGDLTGKNGGPGWSGAYTDIGNSTVVDTTGLAYPSLQTTGGSMRTADGGAATTINFRNLDRIYGDGETETWVSLLGRRNGATATNLFVGMSFYNSTGNAATNSEVALAATNTGALTWRVVDLNNNGTTASGISTTAIDSGTTYLLAALVRWGVTDSNFPAALGTGTPSSVYLYVNPPLSGTPSLASASAGLNINIQDFDKIRLAGQNGIDYWFDEIRIGNTFADIAPVIANNPDFNGNGVGIDDFDTIRNNYLTGTLFAQGDANHDGTVNHLDFFIWRTVFTSAGGSVAGISFSFVVPEPTTFVSLAIAILVAANVRRARRQRGH